MRKRNKLYKKPVAKLPILAKKIRDNVEKDRREGRKALAAA